MQIIELDSGFKYTAYWGGELCKPKNHPEFCRLRQYHDLTVLKVGGKRWIKEFQIYSNHSGVHSAHHDYFSMCGLYHIAVYHSEENIPYFLAFEASTRRDNMQSTFGNYANGCRKIKFSSFKKAAIAIAKAEKGA